MVSGGEPWLGVHLHLHSVQLSPEKLYTFSLGWDGVYEGFPGEGIIFFVRGLMLPNEDEFSSAPVHGALGSEKYSSP